MWNFPQKNLLTLSLSVALVIFTLTVGLAKDNTEQKREAPGWVWVRDGGAGGSYRISKALLDAFGLFFFFLNACFKSDYLHLKSI